MDWSRAVEAEMARIDVSDIEAIHVEVPSASRASILSALAVVDGWLESAECHGTGDKAYAIALGKRIAYVGGIARTLRVRLAVHVLAMRGNKVAQGRSAKALKGKKVAHVALIHVAGDDCLSWRSCEKSLGDALKADEWVVLSH